MFLKFKSYKFYLLLLSPGTQVPSPEATKQFLVSFQGHHKQTQINTWITLFKCPLKTEVVAYHIHYCVPRFIPSVNNIFWYFVSIHKKILYSCLWLYDILQHSIFYSIICLLTDTQVIPNLFPIISNSVTNAFLYTSFVHVYL